MVALKGIDRIEPVSCDPQLLYFQMLTVKPVLLLFSSLQAQPDVLVNYKNSGQNILYFAMFLIITFLLNLTINPTV
jgi:hypothetical protein